jgi:flagellar motility protein MotE (MotC chaperone)
MYDQKFWDAYAHERDRLEKKRELADLEWQLVALKAKIKRLKKEIA